MEDHNLLIYLASIVGLGVTTAWVAWRIKLPSILLLILVGIVIGPYLGFLNTDELFGPLLGPIISLSVAVILFEGGLTLNMAELKQIGVAVRGLLTIGVLVTWILTTIAAHFLLGFDWLIATLVGSILVVTGPTVIKPMLRQIRPKGSLASVLKWEGIVIDPIGVMLAVLVFEIILIGQAFEAPLLTFLTILKTAMYGGALGYVSSWSLYKIYKRNWVPHYLQNAFTLMMVLLIFTLSNFLQAESGLLAVTIMGIVMASQKEINIEHIVEFKENLQLLLIPTLFIILSSRIKMSDIQAINWDYIIFLAALIVVIRPVSVMLATIGSHLPWREKLFLGWMAPRGIVAAAMASIIAIELKRFEFQNVEALVPTVFLVILGTVAIYGLTSAPLAYLLKLADPNPQGILLLGGQNWARSLAKILNEHKVKTLIIDTNQENVRAAKDMDLNALQTNVLAEHADEEIDLSGLGKLFALTPNEQVNSIAALRFAPYFGKEKVYQLSSEEIRSYKKQELSSEIRGRILFSSGMTYGFISEQIASGAEIKTKEITKEDVEKFGSIDQPLSLPLFLITPSGTPRVFAADNAPVLKEGEILVYIQPKEKAEATA